MALNLPCYATREDVKAAADFAFTAREDARVDRAIDSVSRLIEAELHRVFYPRDTTFKWDWPNYQYTYPWKLYLDQWDLISFTSVESPVGTAIDTANVIPYPNNRKPGWPYTHIELKRSTTAAWGAGQTPQLSIAITGTWGFTTDTDAAGTLAAAVSDTTGTSITVSDGSLLGVGDLAIVDSERMLVQARASTTTGLTQSGTGCSTALASDNALSTTGAGTLHVGEVVLLDSERMLVEDVTGGVATVRRAWDGTVLATHSGATVNAYRLLTVARGQLGTAAATHLNAAAVSRHRPPGLIRDLAVAESQNRVLQEISGYSRTVGEAESARPAPGVALADLWDEATAAYGRKARQRAV